MSFFKIPGWELKPWGLLDSCSDMSVFWYYHTNRQVLGYAQLNSSSPRDGGGSPGLWSCQTLSQRSVCLRQVSPTPPVPSCWATILVSHFDLPGEAQLSAWTPLAPSSQVLRSTGRSMLCAAPILGARVLDSILFHCRMSNIDID